MFNERVPSLQPTVKMGDDGEWDLVTGNTAPMRLEHVHNEESMAFAKPQYLMFGVTGAFHAPFAAHAAPAALAPPAGGAGGAGGPPHAVAAPI